MDEYHTKKSENHTKKSEYHTKRKFRCFDLKKKILHFFLKKKDECHTKIINFCNFFLKHTKSTLKIKNGLPAASSAKSWCIFIANDAPWQVDSKFIGFILQKCFYQKLWGFEICRKHKVSTLLSKHYIPAEEVNHTKNLLSTTRIDFICDFSLSI